MKASIEVMRNKEIGS